jgi:SAM-dependent methyltransferase
MNEELRQSYDRVAGDYAEHFKDELAGKPFDRKMLDLLVERSGDLGIICDMGCGPGQVARHLSDAGAKACGIDISDAMVENARALHPAIEFQPGDMLSLSNVADGTFGGIAAFYSIIHIPRERIGEAFGELRRVLAPNGSLLLTFHIGTKDNETVHRDEWWGHEVSIDFNFLDTDAIKALLAGAGFTVDEAIERHPYKDEYPSRRAYIFARK